MPLFSIIIPVYHVTDYLEQAIESALKQTYPNIEVVVIDDGNEEQTSKTITQIVNKYPSTRLFQISHQGVAAARTYGATHAQGEWIVFLDADDKLEPHAVESLYQSSIAFPKSIGHYGNWEPHYEENAQTKKRFSPEEMNHVSGNELLLNLLEGIPEIAIGTASIHRQTLIDANIENDGISYAEDWVMWCMLASIGHIQYVDTAHPLMLRRYHANNVSWHKRPELTATLHTIQTVFENTHLQKKIHPNILNPLRERMEKSVRNSSA